MTILQELIESHPIRYTQVQKTAFRQWALEKAKADGWQARVEENGRFIKHRSVVIGEPEHAAMVFTAHYDTPAVSPLPNLLIPRSAPVFLAWQLLNVALMLAVSLLVTAVADVFIANAQAVLWIFVACYLGCLLLTKVGPANKQNVNNNSSGVAALMQTMAAIPREHRGKMAFILFDDGEKGALGSKAYAREHLQQQYVKTIVDLDCVGVGDTILVIGKKLARMRPEYVRLCAAMREEDDRAVDIVEGGVTTYTSDRDSFKCGVAVLACRRSPGVGYLVTRLNTRRDTQADQGNIDFLTRRFASLAEKL